MRHGLDHILALIYEGMEREQREEFESWLWSDPEREAKILAALGRPAPASVE